MRIDSASNSRVLSILPGPFLDTYRTMDSASQNGSAGSATSSSDFVSYTWRVSLSQLLTCALGAQTLQVRSESFEKWITRKNCASTDNIDLEC